MLAALDARVRRHERVVEHEAARAVLPVVAAAVPAAPPEAPPPPLRRAGAPTPCLAPKACGRSEMAWEWQCIAEWEPETPAEAVTAPLPSEFGVPKIDGLVC